MLTYVDFIKTVESKLSNRSIKKTRWWQINNSPKEWEILYDYNLYDREKLDYSKINYGQLTDILCSDSDQKQHQIYSDKVMNEIDSNQSSFRKMIEIATTKSVLETMPVSLNFGLWKRGIGKLNPKYEKIIKSELGLT